MYKAGKGKAFSYFGTIAKRYLIVYNENNYKKLQEKVDVDESDEEQMHLYENDKNIENMLDGNGFMDQYIRYIDKHLFRLFPKKQDAQTADAIVELFRKRETLEIFNKKALYIYFCATLPKKKKIQMFVLSCRMNCQNYSEFGIFLRILVQL